MCIIVGDLKMKRIYVVNGAAHKGFGEEIARTIIKNGHKVIGLYEEKDSKKADRLAEEFAESELQLIPIDIDNVETIKCVIGNINIKIDGFVNATFYFDMDNVNNFNYALAEKIFRYNYHYPMMMAIELKKKMKKGSSIVFVTSAEAARGSYGGITYAATKAAVHNMIQSLACNWGKDAIRVNAVAPGWIGGEMDTDGPFEVSMNITPLGRLGRAEEVASTVYFLLSNAASFINAQAIFVDGGYLCVDEVAKFEYEEANR